MSRVATVVNRGFSVRIAVKVVRADQIHLNTSWQRIWVRTRIRGCQRMVHLFTSRPGSFFHSPTHRKHARQVR